jgi:hypothetical protein
MAQPNQAAWKRLFDGLDRTVGARVNDFARSEDFATMAALTKRTQSTFRRVGERLSRRLLHAFNLPAGSDVNRLLVQIALLEREVRDLRKEVEQAESARLDGSVGVDPGAIAGARR